MMLKPSDLDTLLIASATSKKGPVCVGKIGVYQYDGQGEYYFSNAEQQALLSICYSKESVFSVYYYIIGDKFEVTVERQNRYIKNDVYRNSTIYDVRLLLDGSINTILRTFLNTKLDANYFDKRYIEVERTNCSNIKQYDTIVQKLKN